VTVLWINGSFVGPDAPAIRPDDAGLLFGRGVYDTFRARNGRVFRLEAHIARITAGAYTLGITMPGIDAPSVVRELCQRAALPDARVRMTLTAGPPGGPPVLILHARPATDYPPGLYERGMSALISPVRRNDTSPLAHIKSLNLLDNVMSREWATARGAHTALLLNTRGLLAEAATANIFLVHDGAILTPPTSDGALPGVTRAAILSLARAAGLPAEERSLSLDDLLAADEAFLTGAVMGIMPLVNVDGHTIGNGKPGSTTQKMHHLYQAEVAST